MYRGITEVALFSDGITALKHANREEVKWFVSVAQIQYQTEPLLIQ